MVVADAGEGAGLGHMSRSGAVAIALRRLRVGDVPCFGLEARRPLELDGQVWVPLRSLHELPIPSVLVLDSYRVPVHTVQGLARDLRLVLMHDLLPVPDQTALVLSLDTDAGPQAIDGLRDACLRPPFWDVPARSHRERLERVLVTTGGGDPGGAGLRIARAARNTAPEAEVALVRGPYADPGAPEGITAIVTPDSLVDELLRADVVVSGAGQTMLEACASGAPCIAVPLADDQREQGNRAASLSAVVYVEPEEVPGALDELRDADARRRLGVAARRAVDGQGALRVAERIGHLLADTQR